jgi:hypothetical protein
LSIIFLRTNETALLERIKTTGLDVIGEHKNKIGRLLVRMAPSVQSASKQEFEHLEQWLGHDLFFTSIMFSSKTARNKPQFSKVIPQFQWTEFVLEQVEMGHEPPNLDSFVYPTTYRDAETRLIPSPMKHKSQHTESPRKEKPLIYDLDEEVPPNVPDCLSKFRRTSRKEKIGCPNQILFPEAETPSTRLSCQETLFERSNSEKGTKKRSLPCRHLGRTRNPSLRNIKRKRKKKKKEGQEETQSQFKTEEA